MNLFFASLILVFLAPILALVVPRTTPDNWSTNLESYDVYHARYLALNCQNQHDTPFFDTCCHPLLAGQSLETARPPHCNPYSNSTSTSNLQPSPQPSPQSSPQPSPQPSSQPILQPQAQPAVSVDAAIITGGFATYFYQNGVAGACGTVHNDWDYIAAIDIARYGDDNEVSYLCGSQVQITNTENWQSVTVTIADVCPTCRNGNSIDLSVAAFQALADLSEGIVPIQWSWA